MLSFAAGAYAMEIRDSLPLTTLSLLLKQILVGGHAIFVLALFVPIIKNDPGPDYNRGA
jgi:hypothetical protein